MMLRSVLLPRVRPNFPKRLYSSHHNGHDDHHGTPASNSTGWPKPSGRNPVRPFERDQVSRQLQKIDPHKTAEDIQELEGWLFGKKVIYLNSQQPFYEQISDESQYMFGERPLPPGHKRYMQDWEILSCAALISLFIMLGITWWAKPETDMFVWAAEELRERRILKMREENRNN